MSAALGSLVVEVAANVARFQSDMGKIAQIAESRMQQVDKAMGLVSNSLKALGAGLVIGLTFEKIKGQIDSAISSAAGMQQLAERTGGTVEKLSGLASVAKLSGTSTDDLASGIQKLSKAMVDAENGGKNTGAAFKAIGVSVAELKGKRADEVFEVIARKQADYADGAGKVAVMQALLGKSGANLLPTMKDLAEAGDLQIKVTAAQAAAADEYEKNQTRLAAAQGALYKIVAMELVPIFNVWTLAMIDSATANNGLKKTAQELAQDGSIAKWARASVEALAFVIDGAEFTVRAFQAAGKTIGYIAGDAALQVELLANGLSLIKGNSSFKDFLSEVQRIGRARESLKDSLGSDLADIFGKQTFSDRLKARLNELDAAKKAIAGGTGRKAVAFNPNEGTDTKTPGDRFIEQLQRQVQQQEKGRFEMLRLEAAQKGVSAAAAPYISQLEQIELRQDRIKRLVEQAARDEEQRAKVTSFVDVGNDASKALIQQTEMLALTSREQRRLTELRRIDEAVQRAMVGATIETRAELERLAETMRNNVTRALDEMDAKETSFGTGATKAWADYADSAHDAAKNAESMISGSLRASEDALVNFAKTGKLSFSSLFGFMAEEYLRQQIRMAQSDLLKDFSLSKVVGGIGGVISSVAGFFGYGHKDGLSYVPYDGYPAVLHEGERVLTKAENSGGAGGGTVIDNSGQIFNIGQGVSRAEMLAGARQAAADSEARVMRRLRLQGITS